MEIIKHEIERNITFTEDTQLHGMIVGDVTTSEKAILYLHGMVVGNLKIKDDSTVFLHGMVTGDAINMGGRLEIFGMVKGQVSTYKGNTIIDQGALIRRGK